MTKSPAAFTGSMERTEWDGPGPCGATVREGNSKSSGVRWYSTTRKQVHPGYGLHRRGGGSDTWVEKEKEILSQVCGGGDCSEGTWEDQS